MADDWYETVIALNCDTSKIPDFQLSEENDFSTIGGLFGYQSIDFVGHDEFNNRYLLRGKDEHLIRDYFLSGPLEYFENNTGIVLEVFQGKMVFITSKRVAPSNYKDTISDTFSIYRKLIADADSLENSVSKHAVLDD